MKLYATNEKLMSENYPYGFRLRTTKTDYLEFDAKKGFRHVSFTINPKTGRENKPKKGVYNDIMLLGKDEQNYTKSIVLDFYDKKEIEQINQIMNDNFDLFTSEQINYIYIKYLSWIKMTMYAKVQYCNSKLEDLKPLFNDQIAILVKGANSKGTINVFPELKFDWEALEATEEKGYQPFKVVRYGI
jgi:hypothetical protein